ncbi:MAG: aminoacyl-tRNA hydrolase, partial [Deltaproteobacteria bacterium]|nr:aminoacyl-tRNA hydrolase [Deltaproteobacteria bacterium]
KAKLDTSGALSLYGRAVVAGREAILIKSRTYMNLSGDAVKEALDSNSLPSESIIVAHDDCDLPLGRIRIRKGGGSGGHRGVASVIERLGTNAFPRVRLGIGRPAEGELHGYVLSPFDPDEEGALDDMLKRATAAVEAIIKDGVGCAMNRFNAF